MRFLPFRMVLLTITGILLVSPTDVAAQNFLGKSLRTWLNELDAPQVKQRRSAAFALGKMGNAAATAVTPLKRRLRDDDDAGVREAAAFALGEIASSAILADKNQLVTALSGALRDREPLVRRSAATALGQLGRDASSALPALENALGDSNANVRQNVAWALGRIGRDGVDGLRRALTDSDMLVRRDAASSLAKLPKTAARPAINELIACCRDNAGVGANARRLLSQVRKAALAVLVTIVNADDERAIDSIRPALGDMDPEVRVNAALTLANIGGPQAAQAAVPTLKSTLTNGSLNVRRQSAAALGNFGPGAAPAIPALTQALRDRDAKLRSYAAFALGGIGPDAERAVPHLVNLVAKNNENAEVRVESAVALSQIGPVPAATNAVGTLVDVLGSRSTPAKVRERIIWALRVHKSNLRNLDVFPTFVRILDERRTEANKMLRYDCAYMLGVLQGSTTPDRTLDVLLEFLKDDTIQIYVNKKSDTKGSDVEKNNAETKVTEIGKGDGRVMVTQALSRIGADRFGQRQDIIRQLRVLADNNRIDRDLRDQCQALLDSR